MSATPPSRHLHTEALAALETALTRLDLMDAMMMTLARNASSEAREQAALSVLAAAEKPHSTLITEDTAAAINSTCRRRIAALWAASLRDGIAY